ncbi:GH39 family glycosyl hydrolase [Gemmatirosa kalamazoonensis]|nr:beta-xylosidase [Gemmatirosa kalamazoonensis]
MNRTDRIKTNNKGTTRVVGSHPVRPVHPVEKKSVGLLSLLSLILSAATALAGGAQEPAFPVAIRVDAAKPLGALPPAWRFFGADEPNYATMKDGRKLVAELGSLGDSGGPQVYFRTHHLLVTGDGTPALKWGSTNVYTEDARGRPVYDFSVVDRIFATYLARGVRPYVEIGFMPQALSTHPEPYQHAWRPGLPYDDVYTGWAYPPKDYAKWEELVYRWVKHCVERFGRAEVERWYWEVWNEPNIGYWKGTPEEFLRLHDHAIAGVRRALPTARVGGPDVAGSGGAFMQGFLEHVLRGRNFATGATGTPHDFVSFHAKGAPSFVDGHVRTGIAAQLRTIDQGFARIASFPELRATPIVIGESDPDGCAACQGPQLGYRNGTMYASYTAAAYARTVLLAERHGVNLLGALTWAFEFEDQPYFAGFRVLATNGIDLPVLNVFRMLAGLGGQHVSAESDRDPGLDAMVRDGVRGAPDVSALASLAPGKLAVLVWHYHDDDVPGPGARVSLSLAGLPSGTREARVTHYRVDDAHSNAFAEWKRMGSPIAPSREQYDRLLAAGQLAKLDGPSSVHVDGGSARLEFALPRQAVSLVVVEWP